jgi:hypothetical protein
MFSSHFSHLYHPAHLYIQAQLFAFLHFRFTSVGTHFEGIICVRFDVVVHKNAGSVIEPHRLLFTNFIAKLSIAESSVKSISVIDLIEFVFDISVPEYAFCKFVINAILFSVLFFNSEIFHS